MAGRTTWRWIFWSTSVFQAVMILVSFSVFRETYGPLILRSRAERLRRETGEGRYQSLGERLHGDKSPWAVLGRALIRPLRLLVFHPIVQISSVIAAFDYGILYIVMSTFSQLWTRHYGQPVELSGLHYMACALGEIVGSQITSRLMDGLYRRWTVRWERPHTPEARLPTILFGAVLGPLGLFMYGWVSQYRLHWAIVDLGIAIAMLGMQSNAMPLQAYVMESYPDHTSSASAATQFLRSLTAFLFPLFAPRMYHVLGYGWANSALAFGGLILGVPAPFVLWFFGAKLRARAQSSY